MIMYNVYVLWSAKLRKRYVGTSKDVESRTKQHNSGASKFTKGGIPWVLIYQEAFDSHTEAIKRELFLKSGAGRAWLDLQFPDYKR